MPSREHDSFSKRIPFELLRVTQQELERKGFYFFAVEKELTEALVTQPLVHRLCTTIKKRGFGKVAGHSIITFSGYETDPREIFEVPEIRAYYQQLDRQLPELPVNTDEEFPEMTEMKFPRQVSWGLPRPVVETRRRGVSPSSDNSLPEW